MMDISEIYIRMSEGAKKYLPTHEWRDGDFYTTRDIGGREPLMHEMLVDVGGGWYTGIAIGVSDPWYSKPELPDQAIPLLRQDQLQEMVGDYETCKDHLFSAGYSDNEYAEYWEMPAGYWEKFASMEQLWLACVMKEKYGKSWNGKEWIKDE